jgi:hypothetical protein
MEHSSALISEYLLLKIVNNIDTKLLLPVFDTVLQSDKITLVLTILANSIRLKFGKRLTPDIVALLFKYLLTQVETEKSVAETLSLLVYFKQGACTKLVDKKF